MYDCTWHFMSSHARVRSALGPRASARCRNRAMEEALPVGGTGAGCSSTQAEVLLGFLEAAIHTVLYARGVYPPELFELRKQYNVPVRMARHPALRECLLQRMTFLVVPAIFHFADRNVVLVGAGISRVCSLRSTLATGSSEGWWTSWGSRFSHQTVSRWSALSVSWRRCCRLA